MNATSSITGGPATDVQGGPERSGPPSVPTVVLVVDDQAIVGEAVRRMLQALDGLEYHYCQDPREAVATAERVRPTVILQDLVMPEVDGLDLVTAYRGHDALREVPLIVLSSREEATTKAEAFARGANDYLVKLPDPIELVARVRHHSRGYTALLERNAAFDALERNRKHLADEINKAGEYVQSLLDPPLEGPVSVRWRFMPSATLGGDCFGYQWIDDDRFGIFVLDVCGHGVGSALLSVSALNLLRSGSIPVELACDPAEVLGRLNDAFPMARHHGMFFTMWYGVIDRVAGTLRWSGAAHPPGLLMRAGGGHELLDSTGLPVGVAPELGAENASVEVRQGDRLYLYSDGAFEIHVPEGGVWGLDPFVELMVKPLAAGEDRIERLIQVTSAMQGGAGYDDDFSIIEAEVTGPLSGA
ncbi:MAG: fused response regulator/phosphatase [Phycisphaerales bacterium]|nr:fused response regulator/phosphatase [Phycisphaerales bacterium]